MRLPRYWKRLLWLTPGVLLALLGLATLVDFQAPPQGLMRHAGDGSSPQYLDRNGMALSHTYQNHWNIHDQLNLERIPLLLQQAFITAEDQRFYQHHGVDWLARANALWQNLRQGEVVRGASSISEQVVQMLHPRPRTFWSKWMEGFEAMALERRFSKSQILGFYLNQVPFARQRRGILQAARMYFDRDPETLNVSEMLALAVLVRSPSRLDLLRSPEAVREPVRKLAATLTESGFLSKDQLLGVNDEPLILSEPELDVDASHFIRYLENDDSILPDIRGRVATTLDAQLQQRIRGLLEKQLQLLTQRNVTDGAVLVVDHQNNEILAWVNAGDPNINGNQLDAVTTPRQPGSTLKPFLYALAMSKGWNAATIIDDAPMARPVGLGLHSYRNYSNFYYGKVRLRDALANSLNTPAIRAVEFTGKAEFLAFLRRLGFRSLDERAAYYGDGLALGNGEVTLLELVNAYATLARGGDRQWLSAQLHDGLPMQGEQLVSREISSVIGNILSDRDARRLEFGRQSILSTPVPIAAKTGTSNDYVDAWAMGYSSRYTVGVWMGNMDRTPMREVSGSVGPGYVLHSVFAELNRHEEQSALYLSRSLKSRRICRITGQLAQADCPDMNEWFIPGHEPAEKCPLHDPNGKKADEAVMAAASKGVSLMQPTQGLQLAMDPRIPDQLEEFPFKLRSGSLPQRVEWIVDGKVIKLEANGDGEYLWPVSMGRHVVKARYWQEAKSAARETDEVSFLVK